MEWHLGTDATTAVQGTAVLSRDAVPYDTTPEFMAQQRFCTLVRGLFSAGAPPSGSA